MSLRVLIAEDSDIFATVLEDLLSEQSDIEVVGRARDGLEAVDLCARFKPDLVLMDIQMPRLDGLAATEQIMARSPTPILVITSDPRRGGVDLSFKALSAGALDLVAKPEALPIPRGERLALIRKMRLLAQVPVVRHMRGRPRSLSLESSSVVDEDESMELPARRLGDELKSNPLLVGIVASTGGPRALAILFDHLTLPLGAAVLVVQHITPGFSAHLASWLDAHSPLQVLEARTGIRPQAGTAYIAPTDVHLELGATGRLRLRDTPPVDGHKPSGNLLLKSLADHAAGRALGVILSGMGSDGARGMAALREAGGLTLAQDEKDAVVYSMPRSAIDAGAVTRIASLTTIAREITREARRLAGSAE